MTSGENITDCVERCSRYGPKEGQCAVTTYYNGSCYYKSGTTSSSTYNLSAVAATAMADQTQLTVNKDSLRCPYANHSSFDASNGYVFTIECDKDAMGYDLSESSGNGYYTAHHASSMQDCIEWCANGESLCYGVAYCPNVTNGYWNCFPKGSNITKLVAYNPDAILHTAVGQISYDRTQYQTGDTYKTSAGSVFGLTSGAKVTEDNYIGRVHQDTFHGCIDYCSTYRNGSRECTLASYQPEASDGYMNCYLHSPTGKFNFVEQSSGYNFAVLASSGLVTTPVKANESKSKTWIAGAVLGPLLAIALAAGFLIWRRRSKQKNTAILSEQNHARDRSVPYLKPELEVRYSVVPVRELGNNPVPVYASSRNHLSQSHELPSVSQSNRHEFP